MSQQIIYWAYVDLKIISMIKLKPRVFPVGQVRVLLSLVSELRGHFLSDDFFSYFIRLVLLTDLGSSHPSSGPPPILSCGRGKGDDPAAFFPILPTREPAFIDVLHGNQTLVSKRRLYYYGDWIAYKKQIYTFVMSWYYRDYIYPLGFIGLWSFETIIIWASSSKCPEVYRNKWDIYLELDGSETCGDYLGIFPTQSDLQLA